MALIKAGTDLADAVSLPRDKLLLWLPQIAHITAMRLFIKWRAFEKIPTGEGEGVRLGELADALGADVKLITRFARSLVANGTLRLVGTDRVAHTDLSRIFTTENPLWAMMQQGFDNHFSACSAMPRYFEHFGLASEPTDRLQTPLAFAENRLGSTVWEIMHESEERLRVFMLSMAVMEEGMPPLGTYDLSWAVQAAQTSADRVLVVDVGGGRGQALKGILKATPGLPANRCVLEDLPEVVEAARREDPELAEVQMAAVDFHKEQPIKGALVYYMRRCLHDYSDDECVGILRQIAGAMAADSRLLIVEVLLADPPNAFQTAMDIMMMNISGKERTLDGFREITGKAGLQITKVAPRPGGSAVVECALV